MLLPLQSSQKLFFEHSCLDWAGGRARFLLARFARCRFFVFMFVFFSPVLLLLLSVSVFVYEGAGIVLDWLSVYGHVRLSACLSVFFLRVRRYVRLSILCASRSCAAIRPVCVCRR